MQLPTSKCCRGVTLGYHKGLLHQTTRRLWWPLLEELLRNKEGRRLSSMGLKNEQEVRNADTGYGWGVRSRSSCGNERWRRVSPVLLILFINWKKSASKVGEIKTTGNTGSNWRNKEQKGSLASGKEERHFPMTRNIYTWVGGRINISNETQIFFYKTPINFQVLIMEFSEIEVCLFWLLILNSSMNKILETLYF